MTLAAGVRSLFRIFFYLVLANVPCWIASRELGLETKGLFALEFIAIGIIALATPLRFVRWLLPVAIVVDILCAVHTTFLLSAEDLFESMASLPTFAAEHVGSLIGIAVVAGLIALLLTPLDRGGDAAERARCALALGLLAVAMWGFDASHGAIAMVGRTDVQVHERFFHGVSPRLTDSFLHRAWMDGWSDWNARRRSAKARLAGATAIIAGDDLRGGVLAAIPERPDIVLVLVVSWGEPLDSRILEALTAPYRQSALESLYSLHSGAVPFLGTTVSGEMRELCASGMGLHVLAAGPPELSQCLPGLLRQRGYRTIAVHGFKPRMFERQDWYPRIGFDETWFLPQLRAAGPYDCPGPFPGLCDAAAASWVQARLQRPEANPQFLYWLTLNSHLPVPPRTGVISPASCSVASALEDAALCTWYQLIANVHRSVAQVAQSAVRPTVFIVVGDHAPPFSDGQRRKAFSFREVPYVVLWPRQLALPGGPSSLHAVQNTVALQRDGPH